jgi:hypothetical protein
MIGKLKPASLEQREFKRKGKTNGNRRVTFCQVTSKQERFKNIVDRTMPNQPSTPGFNEVVKEAWNKPTIHTEPCQILFHKMKETGKCLRK